MENGRNSPHCPVIVLPQCLCCNQGGYIIHLGFKYHLNKRTGSATYYRCANSVRGCSAKLVTVGDTATVKGNHTCAVANTSALVNVDGFIEEFIEEYAVDIKQTAATIYESLIQVMHTQFSTSA